MISCLMINDKSIKIECDIKETSVDFWDVTVKLIEQRFLV